VLIVQDKRLQSVLWVCQPALSTEQPGIIILRSAQAMRPMRTRIYIAKLMVIFGNLAVIDASNVACIITTVALSKNSAMLRRQRHVGLELSKWKIRGEK
jgi:hypothetical protein